MPRGSGGNVAGFKLLSTPNAPTGLSVSAGIGSATVSFTAPADTGDGAITSYVVTAVDESTGASTGATGTESPITVSPGGGTFKIRAQAINAFGPGRLTEFDTGNVIYSGAELYAWGDNSPDGSLGDDTIVDRSSPVQVGAITNWEKISANTTSSAAIKTDGTLWVWGRNNSGQIGDGTVISRSSPVQVGALTNWYEVSCGELFKAAIKTDGTLWTWGANSSGVLGQNLSGSPANVSSPVQVGALTNWSQVSAGDQHCLAVKTDNSLWAWGEASSGQIGFGNVIDKSSPTQVGALLNWAKVSTQANTSLAVKTDGTLWSWGNSTSGILGDNTTVNKSSPVQIGALTNWSSIGMGTTGAGAIKQDGTLWAWGQAQSVPDISNINRSSPVQIGSLTWSHVSMGASFGAAIKTDGTLWTWGIATDGRNGQNTNQTLSSPVQIGLSANWYTVSAGEFHTLAVELVP